MNEITPHDPVRHAGSRQAPRLAGRRFARRSPLASPPDSPLGPADLFRGLRIVLHECDRRSALVHCLANLRWLALRGAEVVLFDGSSTRDSADGSLGAVERRFPFVAVAGAQGAQGFPGMLEAAAAPLTFDRPPPRWILALSADREVDRFSMQALIAELGELPAGTLLVPGVVGPDGCPESSESGAGAWLVRRSDLIAGRFDQLDVRASSGVSFLAPRPVRGR